MELVYDPFRSGGHSRHPRRLVESAALASEARFHYFLDSVLACHHAWGLCRGRHWLLIPTSSAQAALPLWPSWEHAEDWNAHQHTSWHKEYAPRQIRKQELVFELLPLLKGENLLLAIFFVPENQGITIDPDGLLDWLI